MKYRELKAIIESDGWVHVRTTGSHLHFKHPDKNGIVTIPGGGKMNRDVAPGTLKGVLRQAGLSKEG